MSDTDTLHEIEPRHFRAVMGRFATGVTVVTVSVGEELYGMTANAFMSGSLDPPLCVVSVAKRARLHRHLPAARDFAVNILAAGQGDLANHFAGWPVPGVAVRAVEIDGIPALADAAAHITATVVSNHDCGDHTIFVGHIKTMRADERPPLVYHAGRYAALGPVYGPQTPLPEFW